MISHQIFSYNASIQEAIKKIESHGNKFDNIETKLDEHDKKFYMIISKFDEHDKKVDFQDKKIDAQDKKFDRFITNIDILQTVKKKKRVAADLIAEPA